MAENFSLGKKGKFGFIDFSKIMSGVKKDDVVKGEKADIMKSLFTIIDENNDGVLSREEINDLQKLLKEQVDKESDGNITEKELKEFLKTKLEKVDKKTVKAFMELLNNFGNSSVNKGVEDVKDTERKSEIVIYEDGHTEEIFDDGSKIITVKNGGKTVVTKKDSNGKITEEKTTDENGDETVVKYQNGQQVETVKKSNGGKRTETIKVVSGQEHKVVVDEETGVTTEYVNGERVKEKSGNSTTTIRDGAATTVTNTENGKITVVKDSNGNVVSNTTEEILENGSVKKTKTTYNEKGSTTDVTIDGRRVSQTKVVDGKEYHVEYDGNGNTVGIIVQNGESISALAKRFGCTVQEILDANSEPGKVRGSGNNKFFNVGEEIKIPKELEADNPALQGRKTKSETVADYVHDEEVRAQKKREEEVRLAEQETIEETIATEEFQQDIEAENIQKESAKQIVEKLMKAVSGWNDHDAIKKALNEIDNPIELKEVERLLAEKGYKATDMYSALENFVNNELQRAETDYSCEDLETYVQKWISNGLIEGDDAIKAQARLAARVIVDGGDGFGTHCNKTKKGVYMIKAPAGQEPEAAKKVYEEVNRIISQHRTFYGIGTKSKDLMDYLDGEICDDEIKYIKGILAETNAIQGKEKALVTKELVEEAVSGGGTNIEELKQAIKSINSPEDRKAIEAQLQAYCKEKGIEAKLNGQDALQAIFYDESDNFMGFGVNHEEIRKFNEMLIEQGVYTDEEAVRIRAEQIVLQLLAGGFGNAIEAAMHIKDEEVLKKVEDLLKTKGYDGIQDYLNKNIGGAKNYKVKAELAANGLLSDADAYKVALQLLSYDDFDTRAMGLKAIRNEAVAKQVDEALKRKGSSLKAVVDKFNEEKKEYAEKAEFWDSWGKLIFNFSEFISDGYRENTDVSDDLYVEIGVAQHVDAEDAKNYSMTINVIESNLKQLEKAYQDALDSQGAVSDFVNGICDHFCIGTTREEIQARIEHDKETLRLLKLAAQGKLGKMQDGVAVSVSFAEVFNVRQSAVAGGNEIDFDKDKVSKVSKQAQRMAAMEQVKTNVAIVWRELESAVKSGELKQLAVAIFDTLEKLSQFSCVEMSLAKMGYSLSNGIIVDTEGKAVSKDVLLGIVSQLKQGLADMVEATFGEKPNIEISSDEMDSILNAAYDKNIEGFKQEFIEAFGQEPTDEMLQDYIKTINYGSMGINFVVAIGAAIAAPFTGGGSLVAFLGGGATGAAIVSGLGVATASFALNSLEKSTDADGYTNTEWTDAAEQAIWDGVMAAAGAKIGAVAEKFVKGGMNVKAVNQLLAKNKSALSKFIKNPNIVDKAAVWVARAEAAGFEVSSDSLQSLVQMYCQEGRFDEKAFLTGLLMSIAGNVAGHTFGAVGDMKKVDIDTDPTPGPKPDPEVDPTPGPKPDSDVDPTPGPKVDLDIDPTPKPGKVQDLYAGLDDSPVFYATDLNTRKPIQSYADMQKYLSTFNSKIAKKYDKYFWQMFQDNPKRFYRVANSGLFDLVKRGAISEKTLDSLIPENYSREGYILSHRTLQQIKTMKDQLDRGIKPSLVKVKPQNAPKKWMKRNVNVGDVFQDTNGKLYINLGNNKHKAINMSKEKFDELFPILGNINFKQGVSLGDCWLVSTFDSIMDMPEAKAKLFSMFEQRGNDIYIRFPGAKKPIRFRNSEVIGVNGLQITGDTKGIQMLEQAYSVHRNSHYDDTQMNYVDIYDTCFDLHKLHMELDGGTNVSAWNELFGTRNTGFLYNEDTVRQYIIQNANKLDKLIGISFQNGPNGSLRFHRIGNVELYGGHAYIIKSYDPKTGNCYLTNPHHSATLIEVPLQELLRADCFKQLEYVDLAC